MKEREIINISMNEMIMKVLIYAIYENEVWNEKWNDCSMKRKMPMKRKLNVYEGKVSLSLTLWLEISLIE